MSDAGPRASRPKPVSPPPGRRASAIRIEGVRRLQHLSVTFADDSGEPLEEFGAAMENYDRSTIHLEPQVELSLPPFGYSLLRCSRRPLPKVWKSVFYIFDNSTILVFESKEVRDLWSRVRVASFVPCRVVHAPCLLVARYSTDRQLATRTLRCCCAAAALPRRCRCAAAALPLRCCATAVVSLTSRHRRLACLCVSLRVLHLCRDNKDFIAKRKPVRTIPITMHTQVLCMKLLGMIYVLLGMIFIIFRTGLQLLFILSPTSQGPRTARVLTLSAPKHARRPVRLTPKHAARSTD